MTADLPVTERDKFLRICGMLGSAFDGERASAALLASRMLKNAGLVWADVVCVPQPGPRREPPRRDRDADPFGGRDWRTITARCGQFPHLIDKWEADFLEGLPRFPRLSAKQANALTKIMVRLQACGCRI
jgi:hypothetical protein